MSILSKPEIYDWECSFLYPHLLKDVNFWINTLKNETHPILEAGAGTGRISIPLAEQGHSITALDISIEMLELLMTKTDNKNVEIQQADLCRFDLNRRFGSVIFPYTIFQLLPDSDSRISCLNTLNNNLVPEGKLFFDLDLTILANKNSEDFEHQYTEQYDNNGAVVSLYSKTEIDFSDMSCTWNDVYRIFHNGKKEILRNKTTLYALSLDYMDMLFKKCGFVIYDIKGGYNQESLTQDSERMVIFAEKVSEASE